MTYGNAQVPQPPRKNNRKLVIALVFLCAAVLLLCCAGIVSGALGANDPKGNALIVPEATFESSTGSGAAKAAQKAPPPATAAARTLRAADIELTVKTTKKDCFGSAGCNVQYQIKAAIDQSVNITDSCDVTYEVKGLEDTATATLTIVDNDTYNQDSYQSGSTTSSAKKLTAKVTDVECE